MKAQLKFKYLKQGDSVLVEEGKRISIFGGTRFSEPEYYSWTEDLNWNTDPSVSYGVYFPLNFGDTLV